MNNWMPTLAMLFISVCTRRFSSTWHSDSSANEGKRKGRKKRRYHNHLHLFHRVLMSLISPFCMLSQGRRNMARKTSKALSEYTWQCLEGKFAQEVLRAPKTGGDPHGASPAVHKRIVRYLLRTVAGASTPGHLALIAAVLSAWPREVAYL